MNKTILLSALMLLVSGILLNTYAQSEWQPKAEKQQVYINAKTTACNDVANGIHKELILLKIENKNTYPVNISFKKEVWYNDKCTNCDVNTEEHKVSLRLGANESVEAACKGNSQLSIFSKMLNMKKSVLTQYELKDINVTPVK